MSQTSVLRSLAGLLLAAALLAACAEPDAGDPAAAGGAGSTTTAVAVPTTAPTSSPGPTGGQVTATGTVRAGVEPGCLLLHADHGRVYLLVGGDRGRLRAGGRVQVTGRLAPDLLSTCQQGQPLQVASVEAAP
jgi:Protein of unknown function (DUF5818)